MSKLNELIAELCPDGMAFKELGECVVKNIGGGTPSKYKSDYWNGAIPWASVKDIAKANIYLEKTQDFITDEGLENSNSNIIQSGNIIIATRINPGKMVIAKIDVAINQDLRGLILRPFLNEKFLIYYFQTLSIEGRGTTVKGISVQELERIKIPVPPLPVQREIVRILDSFTACTTELIALLTKELAARKKQYEHYRDSLLTFDDGAARHPMREWIAQLCPDGVAYANFGDLATIVRGASPRPIAYFITTAENGINWIKIGDVSPESKYITSTKEKITSDGAKKSRFVKKGDFVLSNSMSFGRPYILKIDGCIHDGWLSISDFNQFFTPDFLYHLLSSGAIQRTMSQRAPTGTVQNLNADIVRTLKIPVPPLPVQREIVRILDRFESFYGDLMKGLSAEIAARKKQYEYYRDKLLTFEEAGGASNNAGRKSPH